MESLVNFALKEKYTKVKKLRSRLEEMNKIIDWNKFVELFPERKSQVGRPNYEKILLLKMPAMTGYFRSMRTKGSVLTSAAKFRR